ncbi:hypothetical protein AURDEDRAFT_164595 [Auricularia subglabra TFB-10046 SS5]|nr:hypothetical protein AURDEDRAFT_164595 [Auricularia subglabra TFB-10046 SS5]
MAMNRTDPSRQLPVELIFLVLDSLDLSQLVQASHLCRTWRALALDHPTFWRMIRLSASSASALEFFQARLDQAGSRHVYVDIHLENCELYGHLRSAVLPAVARSLSHMHQLALNVPHAVSPTLIEVLSRPAPVLEALSVACFHCPDEPLAILPSDLFSGSAPRLRTLIIRNLSLPYRRIAALSEVEEFGYAIDRRALFPASIFTHCPRLRELRYFGGSCPGVDWPPGQDLQISAPGLETLEMQLTDMDFGWLFDAVPNLAALRSIASSRPDSVSARRFLEHMDGPLEMNVVGDDIVRLGFLAPSSRRRRTFTFHQVFVPDDWPGDVFFDPQYTRRVHTFAVEMHMEWLLSDFPPLQACHTLSLVLGDGGAVLSNDHRNQRRAGLLPSLNTVVVVPGAQTSISAATLQAVLTRIVGPRSSRLRLRLDGVHVSGDTSILDGDFECL